MLDLLRPIYEKTAAYGHFGRDEPEFTWERTDNYEGEINANQAPGPPCQACWPAGVGASTAPWQACSSTKRSRKPRRKPSVCAP
jgi:hypothetical protein